MILKLPFGDEKTSLNLFAIFFRDIFTEKLIYGEMFYLAICSALFEGIKLGNINGFKEYGWVTLFSWLFLSFKEEESWLFGVAC